MSADIKRVFKFRIWHNNRMIWPRPPMGSANFEVLMNLNGKLSFFNPAPPICDPYFSSSESIVMQYTGLEDIQGQNVYEGDILESTVDSMLLKWVVIFKNGCFGIQNIGIDGYVNWDEFWPANGLYYFNDRQVIGNIYENPKLMKNEHQ